MNTTDWWMGFGTGMCIAAFAMIVYMSLKDLKRWKK